MCNFGTRRMYPFCLNEFYVLGYIECIVKLLSLTLINNFSAFVSANGRIGICPPIFMELRVRGDNI